MPIGLREIEATQETIQELRAAGQGERADALAAVLAQAVNPLVLPRNRLPRPFFTTGQAARALGVSIQTIKNWAEAGRFRMTLLGGRNVIDREEFLAYLESLRGGPRAPGPFDGPGVDQQRVRAGLPADLVAQIDRHQEDIERGVTATPAARAEARRLEQRATSLARRRLAAQRKSAPR